MDFPIFHLDFMGNRMMVAIVAILHVLINHAIAVGFIPLVTLIEYRGYRAKVAGKETSRNWDELARRIMFIGFIITTSVGALTGVGIWFTASLANPASIGSLIRVFYFAWFTEWIVFVLEVLAIMVYYLTWKKSNESLKAKKRHLQFGVGLTILSWLTMAIIVAILGFMMDPGNWLSNKTLLNGFANPIYLPQLMFRTPIAMIMAGTFALFLTFFVMKRDNPIYKKAIRMISFWILFWTPYTLLASYLYYYEIPNFMVGNMEVAVTTQKFQEWYGTLTGVIWSGVIAALVISIWGLAKPKYLPRFMVIVPLVVIFFFMGTFERVREFIRKPYVIGEYMYANGILKSDYELYKAEGMLKHAAYSSVSEITPENSVEAGREVFKLACTRCHTTFGINSVVEQFENMYGKDNEFNKEAMVAYMKGMHNVRIYMPPFPGTDEELQALADYIIELKEYPDFIEGAQTEGVSVNRNTQL